MSGFAHGGIPQAPASAWPRAGARRVVVEQILQGPRGLSIGRMMGKALGRGLVISPNSFAHPSLGPWEDGEVAHDSHFATSCGKLQGSPFSLTRRETEKGADRVLPSRPPIRCTTARLGGPRSHRLSLFTLIFIQQHLTVVEHCSGGGPFLSARFTPRSGPVSWPKSYPRVQVGKPRHGPGE